MCIARCTAKRMNFGTTGRDKRASDGAARDARPGLYFNFDFGGNTRMIKQARRAPCQAIKPQYLYAIKCKIHLKRERDPECDTLHAVGARRSQPRLDSDPLLSEHFSIWAKCFSDTACALNYGRKNDLSPGAHVRDICNAVRLAWIAWAIAEGGRVENSAGINTPPCRV